jgi:hypothetical protein
MKAYPINFSVIEKLVQQDVQRKKILKQKNKNSVVLWVLITLVIISFI